VWGGVPFLVPVPVSRMVGVALRVDVLGDGGGDGVGGEGGDEVPRLAMAVGEGRQVQACLATLSFKTTQARILT
jgi:hypothetical protein